MGISKDYKKYGNLRKFNFISSSVYTTHDISFHFMNVSCTYLARKEATMLSFNVLAETHLQQSKPHMQSLYNIRLAC